jgi:hypothetical protein
VPAITATCITNRRMMTKRKSWSSNRMSIMRHPYKLKYNKGNRQPIHLSKWPPTEMRRKWAPLRHWAQTMTWVRKMRRRSSNRS